MLNLKKVIASICVIAMVLSTVAFGATYTDVAEDSAYYEAVETLNKLEIVTGYEDGTYKPEDGVTRAEMAALIARIQGYGETAKAQVATSFTDVPATHWASGYIANAAGMGIINGYGNGTFGPEDPVLYEQAVKMVMATLGYTPFAEKNGGYPTGYLAAAQRYDVSLAVANAVVGAEANRGTVAQILANAIDTPLMVQSKWNTNGEVEYVIADGKSYDYKTLMSENLGYVKIRGVVESNTVSDIAAAKTIDTTADAVIEIDVLDTFDTNNKDFDTLVKASSYDYIVGETDAEEYLGRSVIAYVKKVDNKYELISIAVDTARDEELVITVDQYDTVGTNVVNYYKDGANNTTEIKTEAGIAVILNGAYQGTGAATIGTVLANAANFGGAITFVDNDEVKGYNVAFIDLASTGVVKKVTDDGILFHNNVTWFDTNVAKEIEIDADDETKVFVLLKDGEAIEVSELAEWDVLSIYAVSETSNLIVAEVVANEVVGTITSRKASATSVGGYAYKVADAWYDVATGAYGRADLGVGEGGTFYVDEFGKIAAFVEDAALAGGATANYAYIAGAACEKAAFGGAGVDVKLQMVTAEGVVVKSLKSNARIEYAADTRVDIDLTSWTDANDDGTPETGSTHYGYITGMIGEVVQYVENSNGAITKLTNALYDTDEFKAISLGGDDETDVDKKYDAENGKFDNFGYVDADALVFIIDFDVDSAGPDGADISNAKLGSMADLDDENIYAFAKAYADKKAEDCNILVVSYNSLATSTTSSIAVVKEAGESTNADGEAIWTLTYLIDGEEVTADTTADVVATFGTLPTEGDVLKVKVGSEGVITNLTSIWNFATGVRDTKIAAVDGDAVDNTPGTLIDSAGSYTTGQHFAGGVVTNYKESSTEATIGGNTYKLSKAANVYVIDTTGKNIVIKNGSDGNFKYFEAIYDAANDNKIDIYVGDTKIENNKTAAEAQAFADHVYVRSYDGKVTDVVIVKGPDMKVKVNAD